MEAELTVGFLSFKESYVSQVTCHPYHSVEAVASSSTPLFKSLSTTWRFQSGLSRPSSEPLPSHDKCNQTHPTLVTLDIAYAFANPLHAAVSSTFFGQVSKRMVEAFEARCQEVYGPGYE
jgi:coenzyme Q-binding protein COQ10